MFYRITFDESNSREFYVIVEIDVITLFPNFFRKLQKLLVILISSLKYSRTTNLSVIILLSFNVTTENKLKGHQNTVKYGH